MALLDLGGWSFGAVLGAFAVAALLIAVFGWRLARVSDHLADATGLGEAIFGAVLLGGATSLPGIVTSVTTAWQGYAELAVSNAIGGIAVQTTFLAVADVMYRPANLEHAAASVENLVQAALLVTLLSIPLVGMGTPPVAVLGVHPASVIIVLAYVFGLRLVHSAGSEHIWKPQLTPETRPDEPEAELLRGGALTRTWIAFVLLALTVAGCGYVVAEAGIEIADRTGLSESVVGALITAVATSLPELVTSVAAVRRGALTLAVGGIIGGNSFDVLFVAFSDVAYRQGSIYAAMTERQVFVIALTILLTGVLLLGLLRRERSGVGNIGFESMLVLILYGVGMGLQLAQP